MYWVFLTIFLFVVFGPFGGAVMLGIIFTIYTYELFSKEL